MFLVCGTYLDHFNRLEKKQVGETTNTLWFRAATTSLAFPDLLFTKLLVFSIHAISKFFEQSKGTQVRVQLSSKGD